LLKKCPDIFFQYRDLSLFPSAGIIFKTRFLPLSKLAYFSLFVFFFPVSLPGFFKKSSYRKIPVLEKVKNLFFSRLSNGFHVFGSGECLGDRKNTFFPRLSNGFLSNILPRLASLKTYWGFRYENLEKSRTGNYFKTVILPVSPVGIVFFFVGASFSITMARPREVATLWPIQPLTLASPLGA
jgi:hypothetical protein